MAAAKPKEPAFDWTKYDDELKNKFLQYNQEYNLKANEWPDDHMSTSALIQVVDRIPFQHISPSAVFHVVHAKGHGTEGQEYFNFGGFKIALEEFYALEKKCYEVAKERNCITMNEIITSIIEAPVKLTGADYIKHCVIAMKRGKSLSKGISNILKKDAVIGKVAEQTGGLLKTMATVSLTELANIGAGVCWVSPVVTVLRDIWERIQSYKSIPEFLGHFNDMLCYLTEAIAYIAKYNLYEESTTENRILGLVQTIEKSKDIYDEAIKKCGEGASKPSKFFSSKECKKNMEKQTSQIIEWLDTLALMQRSEQQKTLKEGFEKQEVQTKAVCVKQDKHHKEAMDKQEEMIDRLDNIEEMSQEILDRLPGGQGVLHNRRGGNDGLDTNSYPTQADLDSGEHGQPTDVSSHIGSQAGTESGEPASSIQSGAVPPRRHLEEESLQRMECGAGELVRPRHRRQEGEQEGTRPAIPSAPPVESSDESVSASPRSVDDTQPSNGNELDDQHHPSTLSNGEDTVYPSLPATDEATPAAVVAAAAAEANPVPAANSNQVHAPEGLIVLQEGKTILDAFRYVGDKFGAAGFNNFARSLPGDSEETRITKETIQSVAYSLGSTTLHTLEEKNTAVLEKWYEMNPEKATLDNLYKTLREHRKNQLAFDLKTNFAAN